jgi:hypothetical protein
MPVTCEQGPKARWWSATGNLAGFSDTFAALHTSHLQARASPQWLLSATTIGSDASHCQAQQQLAALLC